MTTIVSDMQKQHAEICNEKKEIAQVIQEMKEQLIDVNPTIRTEAIKQINQLLSFKPALDLSDTQFESLLQFYLSKLNETNVALLRESLSGLRDFLDRYDAQQARSINVSKSVLDTLSKAFDDVQAYPQSVRKLIFDLVYYLVQRYAQQTLDEINQSLAQSPDDSLVDWLIHSIDGEKDPRNLLVAFDLIKYASRFLTSPADARCERMFAVISCYFPITFTPPPSANPLVTQSITKHDLQISLRSAMTSCTSFISLVLALVIDRLLDDDTINDADIAQDCFETMNAVFSQTYNQSPNAIVKPSIGSLVAPFAFQCWQTLRKHWLIHCKLSSNLDQQSEALNALSSCLSSLIQALCPDSINGVSSLDVVNGYQSTLVPLIDEFVDEFRLIDSTIARQYSAMISSLFRRSNNAKLRLLPKIFQPLVEQWNTLAKVSDQQSASHESQRIALLETVCQIAYVCTTFKPAFDRIKDDLQQVLLQVLTCTTSASGFALATNCASSIAAHKTENSDLLINDQEADALIDQLHQVMQNSSEPVYIECCCRGLIAISAGRPQKVFDVMVRPLLEHIEFRSSTVKAEVGNTLVLRDAMSWLCAACVAHPLVFNASLPVLVRTLLQSMNQAVVGNHVAVTSVSEILSVIDIAVQHYAGLNDRNVIDSIPFMKSIPLLVIGLLLVCSINLTSADSRHMIDSKIIVTCTRLARTATASITQPESQSAVIDACESLLLTGNCAVFISFIESQDASIHLHNRDQLLRTTPLLSNTSSSDAVSSCLPLSNSHQQLLVVVAAAIGSAYPKVVSQRSDLLRTVTQIACRGPIISISDNRLHAQLVSSYRAVASLSASMLNKFDISSPVFVTTLHSIHAMIRDIACSPSEQHAQIQLGLLESVSLSVKALSLRGYLEWQKLVIEYFTLLNSSNFLRHPSLCNAWPLLFEMCLVDAPIVLSKQCHALVGTGSINKQRFLIWTIAHLTRHIRSNSTPSQLQHAVAHDGVPESDIRLALMFHALCMTIGAAPASLLGQPINQLELIGFAVRALSMSSSRANLELSATLAIRKLIVNQSLLSSAQLSATLNSELNSLVPSLLHALQSKKHFTVQAALDCIDQLAILPFDMLYPYVQPISHVLSLLTDHPLREVRKRAANMKTQWIQFTQAV